MAVAMATYFKFLILKSWALLSSCYYSGIFTIIRVSVLEKLIHHNGLPSAVTDAFLLKEIRTS